MDQTKGECLGKDIRKIVQVGRTLAITLPRTYLQAHNLRQGDLVEVYFNRVIYIEPVNFNKVKEKLGHLTQSFVGANKRARQIQEKRKTRGILPENNTLLPMGCFRQRNTPSDGGV